jgi:predicted amidohydrolase YtcJ
MLDTSTTADLILKNATILTMNMQVPVADSLAIAGNQILSVGSRKFVDRVRSRHTRVIDCEQLPIHPGFIDAHMHPLAFGKHLTSVKCSGQDVNNIGDIVTKLTPFSTKRHAGEWITGVEYDDETLSERRHPNRWDLDTRIPDNPVRLIHRSGHAIVLNSYALKLAGINSDTLDPVDGVIVRSANTLEPTGVFVDASDFLRDRLGPISRDTDIDNSIQMVNDVLLSYGITSLQDAGHANGMHRWDTLKRLIHSGRLQTRTTMMLSNRSAPEFYNAGMQFGSGDLFLRLGHVKQMLTASTGTFLPGLNDLIYNIKVAHSMNFPVAIHAVEEEAILIASLALTDVTCHSLEVPDRIEHCSEAPDHIRQAVRHCRATVVTQPGFLYWRGDHYQELAEAESLYPIEALQELGIPVAFSSDAPIIDPNPWIGIRAMAEKSIQHILTLNRADILNNPKIVRAIYAYTLAAAKSEGLDSVKGSLVKGKLADLAVSSASLKELIANPENASAAITIINGQVLRDTLTE